MRKTFVMDFVSTPLTRKIPNSTILYCEIRYQHNYLAAGIIIEQTDYCSYCMPNESNTIIISHLQSYAGLQILLFDVKSS